MRRHLRFGPVSTFLCVVLAHAAEANASDAVYPGRFWPYAPTDLAAGDVDGDGDLDLVAAVTAGLQTLRNEGGGTYSIGPSAPGPSGFSVALAHLDLNGKLDAVTGGFAGVFAYPGDGAGGFFSPITLLTGLQNGTPRIGDLDEDGHPDVVVGNSTAGAGFLVFYGTGAGPVNPPVQVTGVTGGGGGGGQVEILDLNGDGHLDVLACSPAINSWLGDGQGNFALAGPPPTAAPLAFAFNLGDFDQDGLADLLVFPIFGTLGDFWKGNGAGIFTGPVATSLSQAGFRVLDYDQDGRPDLASGLQVAPGFVQVLRCVGPAQFAAPILFAADATVSRAFPLDADADGDLDLFVGGSGLALLECRGPADYATVDTVPIFDPAAVATGDVDDDGWDDLVAVRGLSELATALGDETGDFAPFVITPAVGIGSARTLDVADVDLDGDLDAVVGTVADIKLFHGDGAGGFSFVQSISPIGFPPPVDQDVADVSGDGRPDLVLHTATPGPFGITISNVDWSAATAGGLFGPFTTLFMSTSQAVQDLHLADVSGDGVRDVLFVASWKVHALVASGGTFLPDQTISPPGPWVWSLASGDLDGDGDVDLVVGDTPSGNGVRALSNAAMTFSVGPLALTTVAPSVPHSLAVADADGDGRLDALLLGGTSSTAAALLEVVPGDGAGAFGESLPHAVAAPVAASTERRTFEGDHDGRIDAAFASIERDHVEVVRGARTPYFDYLGAGCPGSGGFVPRLRLDGAATPGGVVSLSLANGLGGATAPLFSGVQFSTVPLPGGCPLHVFPLLPIVFNLPVFGSGPGNGAFALTGPLPGALGPGSVFAFQALVIDPGAPFGFAATNAVRMTVQ